MLLSLCLNYSSPSNYTMPVRPIPVNESIQEIDDNSWIIGERILLSRRHSPSSGSFHIISEATFPLPPSRLLLATSQIQLVYDAGGVSAVWSIGEIFCKVKILDPGATREHVTLEYLSKRSLSFAVPEVYYHAEYDDRYYIILSRLAGQTLIKAWPNMDEEMKQQYVSRVAKVCKELAAWQADGISGVDGQYLSDRYLTRIGMPKDCSPRNLLNNCKDLGMDCSAFMFYHCDLRPGNIIVNPGEGSLGILDWETAGFVPKEWIRTKFCVSSGMDLPDGDQVDWRSRVQKQLEREGFSEISEQ